jgi:hypothetical protein
MTRIEYSITIEASIEKVFDFASDYRNWHRWFEGVSEFKPTTAISQGNGARYAYQAQIMGFSASVETEIRDFVTNRGWTGVSTKGMSARTYWRFEPAGSATIFTYALEYRLPVPILGDLLDALFIRPQWKKIITKSLSNLRNHVLAYPSHPPLKANDESA